MNSINGSILFQSIMRFVIFNSPVRIHIPDKIVKVAISGQIFRVVFKVINFIVGNMFACRLDQSDINSMVASKGLKGQPGGHFGGKMRKNMRFLEKQISFEKFGTDFEFLKNKLLKQ